MKNKLTLLILLVSIAILPTMQSCNKYEDGPAISFRSRAERVANTWKVDNYKVNGNDFTSLMAGYSETFTKGGSYSYNMAGVNGSGTWAFHNFDEEIQLTGTTNQQSHNLFILKLEEKEFWYYYIDGNDKKEFHMIQK